MPLPFPSSSSLSPSPPSFSQVPYLKIIMGSDPYLLKYKIYLSLSSPTFSQVHSQLEFYLLLLFPPSSFNTSIYICTSSAFMSAMTCSRHLTLIFSYYILIFPYPHILTYSHILLTIFLTIILTYSHIF